MPGGRTIWWPKKAGELVTLPFDFASDLDPTETISGVTQVSASVYSGVDPSPANIISGTATISGSKVTQNLVAGVVGVIYSVVCQVATSLGQTLEISAYVTIITDVP